MRNLVTTRRRANEFAAAVDDPAAGHPVTDEHQAFLALVEQLRDVDEPTLRPDFATDLRDRLMSEAPQALAADRPRSTAVGGRRESAVLSFPASPRRRAATAAVSACIVLGGTVGVAAASQAALPGETLYPVKRGIENVQVAIAGSEQAKGTEYLDQASTRLEEISDLTVAHSGDPATPALVRHALDDFTAEVDDGGAALMTSYSDGQDSVDIAQLRAFNEASAGQLEALASTIPAAASDALANAATTLTELDQAAASLCPDCSSLPTLTLSGALLDLTQDPPVLQPVDPGSTAPTEATGPSASSQSSGDATQTKPDGTAPTQPQPTSAGSSGVTGLPGVPGVTAPSPGNSTSAPNSAPEQSGGATVSVPGGPTVTVPSSVPSVPLPSVPLPSLPSLPIDPSAPLG